MQDVELARRRPARGRRNRLSDRIVQQILGRRGPQVPNDGAALGEVELAAVPLERAPPEVHQGNPGSLVVGRHLPGDRRETRRRRAEVVTRQQRRELTLHDAGGFTVHGDVVRDHHDRHRGHLIVAGDQPHPDRWLTGEIEGLPEHPDPRGRRELGRTHPPQGRAPGVENTLPGTVRRREIPGTERGMAVDEGLDRADDRRLVGSGRHGHHRGHGVDRHRSEHLRGHPHPALRRGEWEVAEVGLRRAGRRTASRIRPLRGEFGHRPCERDRVGVLEEQPGGHADAEPAPQRGGHPCGRERGTAHREEVVGVPHRTR